MPLPGNATLSLQDHLRPGDAQGSKPKQAMIVKMSVETLEALQASPQPQMRFEFGKQPGIHIGDSFFSMERPQKENTPHEIYLRTASAAKPNAPLKYYADVIGKFIIRRQLGEDVEDRVRGRTQDAEKKRLERKAILLEAPPTDLSHGTSKKRKDPVPARKTAAVPRRNITQTAPALPSRISSPLPPGVTETAQPLRNRLIHCLAIVPRTTEYLTRMVYGANPDTEAHKDFLNLLNQVAEQVPQPKKKTDNQPPETWKLKTRTWMDVRPYEWPKLSEPERTNMARHARIAYQNLKIPESDPIWEHVRYRNTVQAPPIPSIVSSSHAEGQTGAIRKPEPKKPAMPKEKSKASTRKKAEQPVMVKDESSRATAKTETQKQTLPVKLDTVPAQKPARRLPGSGFKAQSASVTPPIRSPLQKPSPTDGRESKREAPTASGSARSVPPIPPPAKVNPIPRIPKKKTKEPGEYENASGQSGAAIRKKIVNAEEGELVELEPPSSSSGKRKRNVDDRSLPVKDRRSVKQEEGELIEAPPVRKKRRTEDGASTSSREHLGPPKKATVRDPSKDQAHSPRTSITSDKAINSSKSLSNQNVTTKFKRGSDNIYTSSEDDLNTSQSAKNQHTLQTQSQQTSQERSQHTQAKSNQPTSNAATKKKERFRAPLPKDLPGLRTRYKSAYLPYIKAYQQVVTEKTKLENALNGTLEDSDGDVDFMDADELKRLIEEYRMCKDELEKIQDAYSKAGGHGVLKPEPVGTSGSSPSD